jgi:ATP-dependent helicase HrpA
MIRKELPVYKQKDKILEGLRENQVIIVESPTGSGKTTQIPLILHEAGFTAYGKVAVTQPRRIAAMSVASYIASELDSQVPGIVGYTMRFHDETVPETKIKIMTDGILLQEIKHDEMLSQYSVLMVDEAHERSLNIDFILGLLKRILRERPEFKVIVSSATINSSVFSEYFDGAPVIHIETPMYHVETRYRPPVDSEDSSSEARMDQIFKIVLDETRFQSGDILIFLQGEFPIKECMARLSIGRILEKFEILPLYGRLSKEEQEQVFLPTESGKRKIVISTNIAETSVTIDGITTVIDSGLAKINYYNPRTYTSSLIESAVSKASCNQRLGRAGRTRPGVCYRLYSEDDYAKRPMFTTEEIYRTDLTEVVMRMSEIGIRDFEAFDFISNPGREAIHSAVQALDLFEALNSDRSLSEIGRMMAVFPLMPRLSRMLVESMKYYPDVLEEVLIACSFLSTNSPFLLPQGEEMEARKRHHSFRHEYGDFVSYLQLFDAFLAAEKKTAFCKRNYLDERVMLEIVNIKEQLAEIVENQFGMIISSGGDFSDYLKAIARGLIQFVCRASGRFDYASLTAGRISIHPGSVMFRKTPEYFVAGEIVKTSRTFARSVSPLKREWLQDISPMLLEGFGRGTKKSAKPPAAKESDMLRIGPVNIALKKAGGKRHVVNIPYEDAKKIIEEGSYASQRFGKKIRMSVSYKGEVLIDAEKINVALNILKNIPPEKNFIGKGFSKQTYNIDLEPDALMNRLDDCMKIGIDQKKKNKQTGFITLYSNGNGDYWFRISKSVHSAVGMTLASLEMLADELEGEKIKQVNTHYRRVNTLLEQI